MEPLEVTDVDFHMLCKRDDKGVSNIIENIRLSPEQLEKMRSSALVPN